MKRLLLLGVCGAVALTMFHGNSGAASATASSLFGEAYKMLIRGDVARDEGRFYEAAELYRAATGRYAALKRQYPDWEPGATRFRLNHCYRELARIEQMQKDERLSGPAPATQEEDDNDVPPVPASLLAEGTGVPYLRAQAVSMIEQGDTEAARKVLLEALRASPDDRQSRILIGIVQCQAQRFDDAVFLLRSLLKDEPGNAHAHAVLGTAYFGLGRYADAAAEMKRVLDIEPVMHEPHFNMAQILLMMDPPDAKAAEYHYRKSLRLGGASDSALEKRLTSTGPAALESKSKPLRSTAAESSSNTTDNGEIEKEKQSWLRSILPW